MMLCQWISNATGKPVIAGPKEITAVENLLMQLKVDGEIKSIEEGRRLSHASSKLYEYSPRETEKWDGVYNRFINIIGKK